GLNIERVRISRQSRGLNIERVRISRQSRREELLVEIARDKDSIAQLDAQLARLDHLRGDGNPDTWSTPFFVEMANLWTTLTGKRVPKGGGTFTKLLQEATRVASGGRDDIEKWGQAKTLHIKFKDAASGEGFRLGEADWFCDESAQYVSERGEAICALAEIAQDPATHGGFCSVLASGAIHLRDAPEGSLAFIMREAVLRPTMLDHDMLSPELETQLGWLTVPRPTEMRSSLRKAIDAARAGDQAAAAVLKVAHACEGSTRAAIESLGWTEPAAGVFWNDMVADHEAREISVIEWHLLSGNDKAFTVAMDLIYVSVPSLQNSDFSTDRAEHVLCTAI
ncbi:hypothetical protein, partial [Methylobacterium sp. Leaf113]|uniref:hypothetical protein n=1 Tax=Methylobacterium sp. Leaf113 TaxID=1736259 RepID=UPI000AE0924B